jgi:hypothetical protein
MAEMFDLIPNSDVISIEKIATIEKITALLLNDKIRLLLGNDAKLKALIAEAITASNTHTDQKIADLIDSAPGTLDTLKEIAVVIAEHEELMTSLNNLINTKANAVDVYNKTEIDYKITNANVLSATKWTTARTLTLGGHATGSVVMDGSQNILLSVDIKRGAANGIAELDSNGKVPAAQLPSFVDNIVEATTKANFPAIGESSKIYVDKSTNITYRWGGTAYVEISQSLALGENSSTAFRGDYGKIAYDHVSNTSNPHSVTKEQVGLSNVPNVTTNNQTPTYTNASTLTALSSGETLAIAMGKLAKGLSDFITHNSNTSNPHGVTKTQIGLSNVDNTADSVKNVLSATKWTTARTLTLGGHATGSVVMDGSQNILLSVDIKRGAANGIAELDSNGKVPAAQLPSFVDNIVEATTKANFPAIGESSKIYVDKSTNITYRWGGTAYVEISQSLALGENSSTAFRGDYGKIAYDHVSNTSNPHSVTKAQVGLSNVPNVTTNNQTPTYTEAATLAALTSGEALTISMGKLAKAVSSFIAHSTNTLNPHSVTKAQVGLGNVDNTADSTKNVATAGKWTTARTLSLTGDVTGSVVIDGSGNVSIITTVGDNTHNHTSLSGNVTISGQVLATGATFNGGTNTTVNIIANDDGNAILNLMGSNTQGTGILYMGQTIDFGGGIEYNGDNSPTTSGAGADYIALYRRNTGQNIWTAKNHVNGNDWEFAGSIIAPKGQVKAKTLISDDATIGLGNDEVIKYDDSGSGNLQGYYSTKDVLLFRGDNNLEDNVVVKSGYGHFTQNVYVDKKIGVNKFAMVYNSTEDSLDFIYG